jgi:hypothetical protein
MSYHERPHELGPTICAEAPALSDADREARLRAGDARKESLSGDWSEKSAIEKYASRVNRAVTQYRRERAVSSRASVRL